MILFRSVRELASQALHNLTPTDPEFMAKIGNTKINFQQSRQLWRRYVQLKAYFNGYYFFVSFALISFSQDAFTNQEYWSEHSPW